MRILYIAHRIPYPPNKGDKIRSFNEIKFLASSHDIHLASLVDTRSDIAYEDKLREYCQKVCVEPIVKPWARLQSLAVPLAYRPLSVSYFYSSGLQRTIDQWLKTSRYDAIVCFSSTMAEYIFRSSYFKSINPKALSQRLCASGPAPRLIMDFCDVDSDKWGQYSKETGFPLRSLYWLESMLLLSYEKKINRLFDHSVFVSQQEAELFRCLYPQARNLTVIKNGVDCEYFSPKASGLAPCALSRKTRVLLFTGAMDYHANVEGVTWFTNSILPIIKKDIPDVQFLIAGSNPHPKVKALSRENSVEVTGFVEDIRPYYEKADVCVVPLRLARGVQNKVLEAMSMGKTVVATSKALEGIEVVPGRHALVADEPSRFAAAVVELFEDEKKRGSIGELARRFVMANYDWSANMKKLETLLGAN